MKKVICLALSIVLLSVCTVMSANAENNDAMPTVSAQACVLYCVDDGKVYYSKNENKRMKPASTTKIMTSLITLEYAAASNTKVEFTQDMTAEGSSMYLKVGEAVTLEDLAAGMMMASGNDAANAAAITIAGKYENFADIMNEKASLIGMQNTHFVTPSGLDDENHYSTACDMALLMAYALENEDFAELTSQKSVTVEFVEPQSKKTTYSNHNRLLSMYEYCIGGKTGYTQAAGRCLVSAARKDGLTFVCVTLNDRNDWNDHIALYDYAYEQYACIECDDTDFYIDIPCVGGIHDSVTLTGTKSKNVVIKAEDREKVVRTVYVDSFLYAPICDGNILGRIEYTLDGSKIAENDLVAAGYNNYIKENKSLWTKIKELFTYG